MAEKGWQITRGVEWRKIWERPVNRVDLKYTDGSPGLIATIAQWHATGKPEIKKYDAIIFSNPLVQKTFTCKKCAEKEIMGLLKLHRANREN